MYLNPRAIYIEMLPNGCAIELTTRRATGSTNKFIKYIIDMYTKVFS